MKLMASTLACLAAAYFADAHYFDGLYFNASCDVVYHIWHGY